jgi:hypothetical protein
MRTMSIAAIAIGLIASAPISASAATQTIIESFSLTIPDSVVPDSSQNFAQFDSTRFALFPPTIGTLESVNVTVSGAVSVASLVASPDVSVLLVGAGGPVDEDSFQSGTADLKLSGSEQIASFIGTGSVQVPLLVISSDPTPNASLIESNGPLSGAVLHLRAPNGCACDS